MTVTDNAAIIVGRLSICHAKEELNLIVKALDLTIAMSRTGMRVDR